MSSLTITEYTDTGGTVHIIPAGEVDGDNAHELRETISALLATASPTPAMIRLDMSGVAFIDSVGIGVLVSCYHAAAASDVRLMVINPTAYVHRLLYVSGLLGLFGSPARPPEGQVREPAI